jgi:uncharacterized Zn-binding protein involved in type VI secretion
MEDPMLPAARVSDMQTCPQVNAGPVPHVGGPILPPGEPTVLISSMPAARLSDSATCVGPPNAIAKGEPGVLIGGKPAARMSDTMAHGGAIVSGCPTVLIGSCAQGAALAAAATTGAAYCDKV